MDIYLSANQLYTSLTIQRRSYTRLMKIVSEMFYDGAITNATFSAEEDRHPNTAKLLAYFSKRYSKCSNSKTPIIFFEVVGKQAIMDSTTYSWYNLETAAFIINIIEDAVIKGKFKPDIFSLVTVYTVQVMVFYYPLRCLYVKYLNFGFNQIKVDTADLF